MKKLLTVCLIAAAISGLVHGETIWSEDFSSYVDAGITGAGNNGGYPGSVTKWSIDVSNCTLSDAADYFMAVDTSGGRMEAVDIDGEAIWTSESIDISGHINIGLSVNTSETGSSANALKYVHLFYKLNGGAETAFAVNPTSTGNWGSAVATQSGLSGSTLQIIARVNNPNSGDKSIFDTVTVTGDPSTPVNSAPVLSAIGDQAATVSNALNFAVSATDADNDLITLTASNLPPNAVFNPAAASGSVTGQFNWAVAAPTGTYTTTFYADDGTTNVSETITISITNAPIINVAPVLAPIGSQNVTEGQVLMFTVSASDANNDPLTYTVSDLPPGAVFSTNTIPAQFTWSPAGPTGVTTSRFTVADGMTHDFEDVVITVSAPINNPPDLIPIGDQAITEGLSLIFPVVAIDLNNDSVTLSASNLPPGAVFNNTSDIGTVSNTFTWANAAPTGTWNTTFFADDGVTNASEEIVITVTNAPVVPVPAEPPWSVIWNEPQQSSSGTAWPNQFKIRDALVDRINALQSGHSAVLATFTFSANSGAGVIIEATEAALDRGANVSFIVDNEAAYDEIHGGTESLSSLENHINPLNLVVDDSGNGIMHNKLGLFDYGGTNQWVFIASWNFTLGASAYQWNIALEARSPSLYSVYMAEAAELLAGRFHDDPNKSHAHDGSTFTLDGSWGTNVARFSPPPDGNTVEDDIVALIDGAQSNIVFALNKLNREPIRDALIAAANRGVPIQGVMPRSDTDPGEVSAAVYSALTNHVDFLPATTKANYSETDSGEQDLVHSKYMVIDGGTANSTVIHGSANWTYSALVDNNQNDENTLILRHSEIAGQFQNHFGRITGTGSFSEGNSTLVSWDFEDGDQVADGGIAANANQTVDRVPEPSSYSYTANALSCSGWKDGAGTTYWETSFTTIDHADIKVSSAQLASSTGPADFTLQYKIGAGGTYADVPYSDVHVPTGGNGVLTRVLLPKECENRPEVFLRWLLTSNFRADGSTAIGSTGAGRIDDIVITGTAYDQPPILDPIGDQVVFEGESLSFTVMASDPVDGDSVSRSAINLPTGATFTNGTFHWSTAAPVGIYNVTFTATDKDGSTAETLAITVVEKPLLLISEVADPDVDDAGFYRFVELYNAGAVTIDLNAEEWVLSKQVNGGGTWSDMPLSGVIPPGITWLVVNDAVEFETAYGIVPDQENASVSGNGDDAYVLYRGGGHNTGILIDIFGELDADGSDTEWEYENSRAERIDSVLEPNSTWTASEWNITSGASTNSMSPGQHGPRPVFQRLENVFVFLSDDLELEVTAINTIRTDTITLSASALPDGASFPPITGADSVSSTLTWNNPPEGEYTAIFRAEGLSGTRTASIEITVAASTTIDGKFSGWDYNTIVKLENGQFWRNLWQAGVPNSTLLNPQASISKGLTGKYQIVIPNVPGYATVEPIEVSESSLKNDPSELGNGTIYELGDGTVWEQISWETDSFPTDPRSVWRWTENGKTTLLFLNRYNEALGTCEVTESEPPTGGPIVSRIDGWFRGWENDRIFVLENGQFWQQITADRSIDTLLRPTVTVVDYLETGTMRLYVEGALPPGYMEVQQRTDITRTAIDGMFYGFGSGEFFHLKNGSWWRQTSLDSSASTRSNPEILTWNNNGTQMIEMPDEGRSVSAEQLTVLSESSITSEFSGLHYANIYELGQDWLQISFENIHSEASHPSAMLWVNGNTTSLLARDHGDREIGHCTVINPWADDDGDQIPNASETVAGTSLSDRNDFFLITDIQYDNQGRAILSWAAVSGRIYTVEWTPALNQPFQPLETGIEWPQNSWTDVYNAPAAGGFYRIRVRLAE